MKCIENQTPMKDFLKPDKAWKRIQINSEKDFIKKFLTTGRFHNKVPEEIKRDFEIVEHLQFYSYYKIELLEEAFAKATKIFEASVDLRIQNLQLPSKKGFENLNSKIIKLEPFSTPELLKAWDEVRRLRNVFAHHQAGRSLAHHTFNAFKGIVNIINSVFLDTEEIFERENLFKKLKEDAKPFEKGLFIMKIGENFSLISCCVPYDIVLKDKLEQSMWRFDLVYDKSVIRKFDDFAHPVTFILEKVSIQNNTLKALIRELKTEVEIFPTELPEAIERLEKYNRAFLKATPELKKKYDELLYNRIAVRISELFYNSW